MKLFSLRLTTLKSKLYAIVFASFIVRVVAFFALPNTPSSLGPDEGTYASAANWTALSKPATEFPDFGAGLYVSGRSLLLPAALFNKLGFDPLNSIRITSSLYGLLTLCLVTIVALKLTSKYASFAEFAQQRPRIFFGLISIFAFLPSNFAWSILGLRESTTQFWVMCVFALLLLILHLSKRVSVLSVCGLFISIIMVFSSRPQVGSVLGVTLLIYLLARIKKRKARVLIPLVVLAIYLGVVITNEKSIEVTTKFSAEMVENKLNLIRPTSISGLEQQAAFSCQFNGEVIVIATVSFKCSMKSSGKIMGDSKNPVTKAIDQIDSLPIRHLVNKEGAKSAIKTQTCPVEINSRVDNYLCIAVRAPFTTYTFLFRPMPGKDVTNLTTLAASIENLFWLGSILYILVVFIRNRRLAFFEYLAPSVLFMILYSVAAGAYEGNMGTAFRHKTSILWTVLLLIGSSIVVTQQRILVLRNSDSKG